MSEIEPKSARPNNSAKLVVFLVVFIDLLGFGIVLPFLPRVAKAFLTDYSESTRGIVLGVLYSCFSLMQFLFSPVWGRLSDRIGRRPVLLMSLLGSVVFYGLFAYACTLSEAKIALALFLISRIGAGIAGASVSTAAAVISDCTPKEQRAKAMGLIGMAFGVGFTFGPLIAYMGFQFFQQQLWGAGAIASGISLVAFLIAFVKFRETRQPYGEATAKELFSISKTMEVLRSPAIGPLVLIYFFVIFAFAIFEGTISLYTQDIFNINDQQNFLIFAYIGLVLSIATGGVYRRLVGKIEQTKILTFGIIMMIMGMVGIGGVALAKTIMTGSADAISGLKPAFYIVTAISVFGFAFVNPSLSALVSQRADPNRQGEVQGVNQSFASLGRILGPFIGLYTFQLDSRRTTPYMIAILLLGLVIFILPLVLRSANSKPQESPSQGDLGSSS